MLFIVIMDILGRLIFFYKFGGVVVVILVIVKVGFGMFIFMLFIGWFKERFKVLKVLLICDLFKYCCYYFGKLYVLICRCWEDCFEGFYLFCGNFY